MPPNRPRRPGRPLKPRAPRPVAASRPTTPEWVCHVPAGFEGPAIEEIRARLEAEAHVEGAGELLFGRAEPFDPMRLRCAELCFRRVLSLPSPLEARVGPQELLPAFERIIPGIREVDGLAEKAGLGLPRTVRFVTRMEGQYPYPRQHLRDRVEAELPRLFGRRYRRVEENGGLEIWVTAGRRALTVDVRVSPEALRHRSYQERHREGALRPAVAAALVRYSAPASGETLCDPFCGTGTIGLERSHYGLPYAGLLLGDSDPAAVAAAAENLGRRHEPKRICRWDARRLPLAEGSVDSIVTNPPFGAKSRAPDLGGLYAEAFTEMERVLRLWGRAVVIVGDAELLRAALGSATSLVIEGSFHAELQGRPATVFRLRRIARAESTSPGRTSRRSPRARRPSSRGR